MIQPKTTSLLVYPCTVVGYIRLILLASALIVHLLLEGHGNSFLGQAVVVGLLGLSLLLDGVDGYLARRYNHTSYFGTLLDLMIDLSTHTMVWVLSGFYLAIPLLILEWNTGLYIAAFSRQPVNSWKDTVITTGPALLNLYFRNYQRNPVSIYGNFSHFAFPMALYLNLSSGLIYYLLLPGLVLYELVTFYLLYLFMKILLGENKG